MKKFWQLVSIKHLIFGTALFLVVIGLSFFESSNKVTVTLGEDAVDIKAAKYSMNIPYAMVDSVELTSLPDRGNVLDGSDDMTVRTGFWNNTTWGDYYICADLASTDCIVVHLNDGRIFVFSRKNNEETSDIYHELQNRLSLN